MDIADYERDIAKLREEFAKVDTQDVLSIQKWFAEHHYLSTADHAIVANATNRWIRSLKRKANIKAKIPKNLPKSTRKKKLNTLILPENWDSEDWLKEAAKKHTVQSIAEAAGLSRTAIYKRLRRHKIQPLGKKAYNSKNPYCTYDWCYEHYVVKRWTQSECAEKAGICVQAFAGWLVRFKIPVMSAKERIKNAEVKIWIRKLISDLEKQEVVRKVFLRKNHIHVRFKNYFWESYYFQGEFRNRVPRSFFITREHARLSSIPRIYSQFNDDLTYDKPCLAHIAIKQSDWAAASFLEKRLALHQFAWVINRRDWIHPEFPSKILDAELQELKSSNKNRFVRKGAFVAHPNRGGRESVGFKIIGSFFDIPGLQEALKSPKRTMVALNSIFDSKSGINFHNLVKMICCAQNASENVKIYDAGVFMWILKMLKIKGTVLDLHPDNGYHAIACALVGVKYTAVPTERFQKAMDRGIIDFLGLQYEEYKGQKVDLVLNNDNFRETDLTEALQYTSSTKNILHFVDRRNKNSVRAKTEPTKIIPIYTNIFRKTPDFLFLF
jgi:hypothetical protein